MNERKAKAAPPDKVDRAVSGIKRSIGKRIAFLADEDDAVVEKAVLALAEVGPFAVGPLARALPRAASPRHRAAIIGALLTFGPQAAVAVGRALTGAMMRDPDERLRVAAGAALSALLMADLVTKHV